MKLQYILEWGTRRLNYIYDNEEHDLIYDESILYNVCKDDIRLGGTKFVEKL